MTAVEIWDVNGSTVWVDWGANGKVVFHGQILTGREEYEYAISVPSVDVPKLIAALSGEADEDVIALIVANGEAIVRRGEKAWIESLGITPEFWSRYDDGL